ncbi:hypothetical protein [Actimicrobium sp. CCI2.3]|uniref:hypothetical protein n=1 Tax=Actimicrobium sp. CCI2.3 TaxID=3048616 RepID=UPI002AB5C71E|nr:hypothetical protein [Actimicrobium sp. CCI2.3]MDY7574454.1 hypothetical protein [Actimicrobium sp. CCI2.3]MEB0022468.1 hypothetical protein [Actimicrobium sp. CCI2.3]
MRKFTLILPALSSVLLSTVTLPASAYSLWNRTTDESVCDFSPMTTYRLLQKNKTNIPYVVPEPDQVEGYSRLALREASAHCKDGQVLVLHSTQGNNLDAQVFRGVTSELCMIADVNQKAVPTTEFPKAFEVRCRIVKIAQARDVSARKEAEKPTEEFIRESFKLGTAPSGTVSFGGRAGQQDSTFCLGQLLGIGRCR